MRLSTDYKSATFVALSYTTLVIAAPRFTPRFSFDDDDFVLIARNPYPQESEQVVSGTAPPPPYPTSTPTHANNGNDHDTSGRSDVDANPTGYTFTNGGGSEEHVTSGTISPTYPTPSQSVGLLTVTGSGGLITLDHGNSNLAHPTETAVIANDKGSSSSFLSNKGMAAGVFSGVGILLAVILLSLWICYKRSSRVLKNEKAIAYTNEKPAPPSFFSRIFSKTASRPKVRIVSYTSSFDAATPGSEDRWSTFSGNANNDPFSSTTAVPIMTERMSTQPTAVTVVSPTDSSGRRSLIVGMEYADLIRVGDEENTPTPRATTNKLPPIRTTMVSVDDPELQTPSSKYSKGSAYMNMTVDQRAVEAALRAHQLEVERQIVTPESMASRGPSPYQQFVGSKPQYQAVTGSNATLVGSQRTIGDKAKKRGSLMNPFLSAAEVESSIGHGGDSIYHHQFFQAELKPEDDRECDASSIEIVPGLHRNPSTGSAVSDASSSFWYNNKHDSSDSRTVRSSSSTSNPFALEIDEILGTREGVEAVRWPSPPALLERREWV